MTFTQFNRAIFCTLYNYFVKEKKYDAVYPVSEPPENYYDTDAIIRFSHIEFGELYVWFSPTGVVIVDPKTTEIIRFTATTGIFKYRYSKCYPTALNGTWESDPLRWDSQQFWNLYNHDRPFQKIYDMLAELEIMPTDSTNKLWEDAIARYGESEIKIARTRTDIIRSCKNTRYIFASGLTKIIGFMTIPLDKLYIDTVNTGCNHTRECNGHFKNGYDSLWIKHYDYSSTYMNTLIGVSCNEKGVTRVICGRFRNDNPLVILQLDERFFLMMPYPEIIGNDKASELISNRWCDLVISTTSEFCTTANYNVNKEESQ